LFNLALLGIDNKNRFVRIAKGNEKITIACDSEGGQCDSQKYKQKNLTYLFQ
jgi:hypothetical protein